MKITVVGAGAIGGVIGAQLARAGRDVELVDIVEEHVNKINNDGLLVKTQEDDWLVNIKAATPDQIVQRQEPIECILLCVKAQFTKDALTPLLPLLKEDSFVVSIQNGLCEIDIEEVVGRDRTVGGFVNIFADYIEPGVISYGGKGSVSIGELDGTISERLKRLEQELSDLEDVRISENVLGYLWAKLAYGAILTATALTNEIMADIFANHRYRQMLMNLASEVLAVADYMNIETVKFDDWDPKDAYPIESRDNEKMNAQLDIHVKRLQGYSKVRSGIWRDIAVRKRRTEKPYHFKPIFTIAERANIEMPLTKLLLSLLNEIEEGKREFGLGNLEILLEKNDSIYK
ncbi:2-dehydropantoate 2-reductase [Sporosarcina sp. FSL W8-0480]|uniref:ketopantoate reductase family protein n=1 Tax=Sporosarcina sp. FSL W8-0480 TaxID=2954701 RepID=UPI0030D7CE43